jgi:hypothetical protein
MRLMTFAKMFAVSAILISGTPAFAARHVDHGTRDICHEQNTESCRRAPYTFEIPNTPSDAQARANAASKTWPGDMYLG